MGWALVQPHTAFCGDFQPNLYLLGHEIQYLLSTLLTDVFFAQLSPVAWNRVTSLVLGSVQHRGSVNDSAGPDCGQLVTYSFFGALD